MSNVLIIVTLGSVVSLIGTMCGACLGVLVHNPTDKFLGGMVGFAGGLMLSIVVFDLIPEALKGFGLFRVLFFCLIGILTIACIDGLFDLKNSSVNSTIKVAFMASLGLMIHNLPEGIIMGCGFVSAASVGLKMSFIIAVHDIPEGIAVAAPLMASKTRVGKILFYAFVTAFPTAIGVWIGAYFGNISPNILNACLSYASGIMLYVVCGEMFPESSKLFGGITSTLGIILGILLGLIMINLI